MHAKRMILLFIVALAGLSVVAQGESEVAALNFAGDKVLIFRTDSAGDTPPVRTIEGDDTGLWTAVSVAFDRHGRMYVLNFTGITVYPPGANGDAHPMRTITFPAGEGAGASGLALDSAGNLYVNMSYMTAGTHNVFVGKVLVYPPGASGEAKPIRTIKGSATRMNDVDGLAVDQAGDLYVANAGTAIIGGGPSMRVTVYAPGANGNVAPIRTIEGAATGLETPSSPSLDAAGNLYVSNLNQSTGAATITVYSPGANGDARPIRTLAVQTANRQTGSNGNGMSVDAAGDIYFADSSGSDISVYAAGSAGNSPPTRTVKGASTQLNQTKFVAVWPAASGGAALGQSSGPSGQTAAASAAGPPPPPPTSVSGSVATYGDKDLLGFGYPRGVNPTAGARLTGLAPNAISVASKIFNHDWPVVTGANDPPGSAEFPNTDQIFVGSNQTAQHDGYAGYDKRKQGPAVFRLDYSRLVAAGRTVKALTLGIAADDFQFRTFNQPFSASVNGQPNRAITDQLNGRNETGPQTYFFSVGIDPSILTPDHVVTLSIDEGGDGGDGFAVDFLTVGVVTSGGASAAARTPAAQKQKRMGR